MIQKATIHTDGLGMLLNQILIYAGVEINY